MSKFFFIIVMSFISTNIKYLNTNLIFLDKYQYIYDDQGNRMFTVLVYPEGDIYFFGKHATSSSKYTYHTTGFSVALHKSDMNPTKYTNIARIDRLNDNGSIDVPYFFLSDNYSIDTYRLDSTDVINNVVQLLRNKGYSKQAAYKLLANGVDVYFSNIFEVVLRENMKRVGTQEYYSYEEIKNSLYQMMGIQWSEKTQDLLKYYYDNIINIRLSPFLYDVVYVLEEDYNINKTNAKVLRRGDEKFEIYFGQTTGYEITDREESYLKKKNYIISRAEYIYENGTANVSNQPVITKTEVSAYHGSKQDATLYILLKEQEPDITQKPTSTPKVTQVPTVTPMPQPTNIPEPIIVPPIVNEESYIHMQPEISAVIQALNEHGTSYEASQGIPGNEHLYASVQASPYLISLTWKKCSGTIQYPYTVEKTYKIESINSKTKKKTTKNRTVTKSGAINRSYIYYCIDSIDYYTVDQSVLENEVLPDQKITLIPKSQTAPSLEYNHWEDLKDHIRMPSGNQNIIVLPTETVSSLPKEDLLELGAKQIGEIAVRNDQLLFDGKEVMSSQWQPKETGQIDLSPLQTRMSTNANQLYKDGFSISSLIQNGRYNSKGRISYKKIISYQSIHPQSVQIPISNINPVMVHTPSYCKPVINCDNQKFVQLANADDQAIPLILDSNSITADFWLKISNEGYHSDLPGYHTQDYKRYLGKKNGSSQNEVQFPIDMYQDIGNDFDRKNDKLIKKDTWCCIGTGQQRFYVPMWAEEGKYTVKTRSVASNGAQQLSKEQHLSNTSSNNYVAINTFPIEISGRIYGMTLYDIQDYPLWKDVFREENSQNLKKNQLLQQIQENVENGVKQPDGVIQTTYNSNCIYDYTVGIYDRYGTKTKREPKYTFPLVDGCHPLYQNQGMIKSGYTLRFLLKTTGSEMAKKDAHVRITPRFYYVDEAGANRMEVNLYYSDTIQGKEYPCIQIGSELDKNNTIKANPQEKLLGIPKEELEMTAKLMKNSDKNIMKKQHPMYSYSEITVGFPFRMYSNLSYFKLPMVKNVFSDQMALNQLAAYEQTYYFNYSLPNRVRAVKKGTSVSNYAKQHGITFEEDFWLTTGYLIVNFDIKAVDADGNVLYDYVNKDNYLKKNQCSMWLLEGGAVEKEHNNMKFHFIAGDTLVYSLKETAGDDYERDGLY